VKSCRVGCVLDRLDIAHSSCVRFSAQEAFYALRTHLVEGFAAQVKPLQAKDRARLRERCVKHAAHGVQPV